MNSSMQPTVVSVNPTSGGSSSSTIPTAQGLSPTYPPNAKSWSPEEDAKKPEWEPEFRETFSKSILKMRMKEFEGGKYTDRYIKTYLEFMVLSGFISNLEYLEYKRELTKEQL